MDFIGLQIAATVLAFAALVGIVLWFASDWNAAGFDDAVEQPRVPVAGARQ